MKRLEIVAKTVRWVDQAAARVESRCLGGRVRVVSIRCADCGQWVKAADWNPYTAVCDWCTDHMRLAAATGRFGNSGRHPAMWEAAR